MEIPRELVLGQTEVQLGDEQFAFTSRERCDIREQIDAHHRTVKLARDGPARKAQRAGNGITTLGPSQRAQRDCLQPPAEVTDQVAVCAERCCEGVLHLQDEREWLGLTSPPASPTKKVLLIYSHRAAGSRVPQLGGRRHDPEQTTRARSRAAIVFIGPAVQLAGHFYHPYVDPPTDPAALPQPLRQIRPAGGTRTS